MKNVLEDISKAFVKDEGDSPTDPTKNYLVIDALHSASVSFRKLRESALIGK